MKTSRKKKLNIRHFSIMILIMLANNLQAQGPSPTLVSFSFGNYLNEMHNNGLEMKCSLPIILVIAMASDTQKRGDHNIALANKVAIRKIKEISKEIALKLKVNKHGINNLNIDLKIINNNIYVNTTADLVSFDGLNMDSCIKAHSQEKLDFVFTL